VQSRSQCDVVGVVTSCDVELVDIPVGGRADSNFSPFPTVEVTWISHHSHTLFFSVDTFLKFPFPTP
jgi:hypothetical protein